MWSLTNAESLPSEDERTFAKEAIDVLQKKREELLAEAKKLQQEANDVDLEISKIRSWLAPIRRVPSDVLSLVFVEACKLDWQAPKVLGIVCRFWREALLTTPRAWACIQIGPSSKPIQPALMALWLSRGGVFKLHASLPPLASRADVNAVCHHEEKIQCLSLFNNFYQLQRKYPQLKELRLGPEDCSWRKKPDDQGMSDTAHHPDKRGEDEDISSILSIERFPKLVHLHLHSPSVMAMEAIAHERFFPALTELHIHVKGSHWHSIIRYCAQSLITLAVEYPCNYVEDEVDREELNTLVELPNLQNLHYIFPEDDLEGNPTLPSLQMPNLRSFHQVYGGSAIEHPQPYLATFIYFEQSVFVGWHLVPFMTHLQIKDTPNWIASILDRLEEHPDVCPLLESVDCFSLDPDYSRETKVKSFITRRSSITGIPIRFRYLQLEDCEEDHARYSMCYTYCNCDNPADEGQFDYVCYNETSFYLLPGGEDEYQGGGGGYGGYDGYDDAPWWY